MNNKNTRKSMASRDVRRASSSFEPAMELDDDTLAYGTALDQLLENLDRGTHLSSPTETPFRAASPTPLESQGAGPFLTQRTQSLVDGPVVRAAPSLSLDSDRFNKPIPASPVKSLPASPIMEAASPVLNPLSRPLSANGFEDEDEVPVVVKRNASLPTSVEMLEMQQVKNRHSASSQGSSDSGQQPIQSPEEFGFKEILTNAKVAGASFEALPPPRVTTGDRYKRNTVMNLLAPSVPLNRSNVRTSVQLGDSSRSNLASIDEMPDVNLPGFTPYRKAKSPSSPPATDLHSPSVFRRISERIAPRAPSAGAVYASDSETGSVQRKRSLYHPERNPKTPRQELVVPAGATSNDRSPDLARQLSLRKMAKEAESPESTSKTTFWRVFSWASTWYAPSFILACCGMKHPTIQQAWREKMALVSIVVGLCVILGFISFGFQYVTCVLSPNNAQRIPVSQFDSSTINIRGVVYSIANFQHPGVQVQLWQVAGRDLSWMFPVYPSGLPGGKSACDSVPGAKTASIDCTVDGVNLVGHCHTSAEYAQMLSQVKKVGLQSFTWDDVKKGQKYIVYDGYVLNLDRYFTQGNNFLGDSAFQTTLLNHLGRDATIAFQKSSLRKLQMNCLLERFAIGLLELESPECFSAKAFMWVSLVTILMVIVVRFAIALFFNWTMGRALGNSPPPESENVVSLDMKRTIYIPDSSELAGYSTVKSVDSRRGTRTSLGLPKKSRFSSHYNMQNRFSISSAGYTPNSQKRSTVVGPSRTSSSSYKPSVDTVPSEVIIEQNGILRTIVLVTCYSEGQDSLRTTLDSVGVADFPDSSKLLFIIADGIVTGADNPKSTPDLLIDMIQMDPQFEYPPPPHSYVAIADGTKRHNMAQVYAGRYVVKGRSVPTVLVVKCGTPEEKNEAKPGNRGKRDSQIILMQFLSKVMFDDRMTPLEYDLFTKISAVASAPAGTSLDSVATKITPDLYELVLMVDADTEIMPDSLTAMSYAMASDPKLIGLCGETRIANKFDSFWTAIQVYEYYISHFLAKSFETVFGSVTCLPGCFCMYRVKAPKPVDTSGAVQYYVPILANPDIVEGYSENVVDTLHKKNLLLLGEDRYLTTLMLKTFPKRKLMFVPRAVCKTVVPDSFRVLLSQRRRWINSTVHNLLELVMLRDLCGIFCFSMQFVILMELVGTAVLPAAITFTCYLIIASIFMDPKPLIPLFLLAAILGLPALLILFSSLRWQYALWMLIYLVSLPIWNFVLPAYAFWHFDDFSWGETRKVEGMNDSLHGEKEGQFDPTKITMKRWFEWERIRRRKEAMDKLEGRTRRASVGTEFDFSEVTTSMDLNQPRTWGPQSMLPTDSDDEKTRIVYE